MTVFKLSQNQTEFDTSVKKKKRYIKKVVSIIELHKLFFKNDNSKIKLYLDKELILGDTLSVNAKLVYIALRAYKNRKDFVVYDYLKYILTNSINPNKSISTKITQGLSELAEKNYIVTLNSAKIGSELLFDNLYFETDPNSKYFKHYVVITLAELHTIMNLKSQSPENILLYFCGVISTISNSSKSEIGDKSIFYLAKLVNVSKSTAIRYNQILSDNNLLHIEKSNQAKVDEKGRIISSLPNIYSRPQNKGIAEAEQLSREQTQGNLGHKNLSTNADKKRSIAMKLLQIKKGKGNYSLDELKEIIKYIENDMHNKNIEIKKRQDEHERGLLSEKQLAEQLKYFDEEIRKRQSDLELVQNFYNKTELRLNDEKDKQFLDTFNDDILDFDCSAIDDEENNNTDICYENEQEERLIKTIKKYFVGIRISSNDLTKLRHYKDMYSQIKKMIITDHNLIRKQFSGIVYFDRLFKYIQKSIDEKQKATNKSNSTADEFTQWLKNVSEGKYRITD